MYYKIPIGSDTYLSIKELYEMGQQAHDLTEGWLVRRFGKVVRFQPSRETLWGGIGAVNLAGILKARPQEWAKIDGAPGWFVPAAEHLKAEIAKLPSVPKALLKGALGYGNYPGPKGFNTIPTMHIGQGYFIVRVPHFVRGYEPVAGMVEILGTEYVELFDKAELFNRKALEPKKPTLLKVAK